MVNSTDSRYPETSMRPRAQKPAAKPWIRWSLVIETVILCIPGSETKYTTHQPKKGIYICKNRQRHISIADKLRQK